jgi:hypothetical protein
MTTCSRISRSWVLYYDRRVVQRQRGRPDPTGILVMPGCELDLQGQNARLSSLPPH